MKQFLTFPLVVLVAIAGPAWCTNPDSANPFMVKRDPFDIPKAALARAGKAAARESADSTESDWQPQLRAILHDEVKPMVNIDGQIIGLGDSVRGYRLLQVKEREAVLGRDGQHYRLRIDGVRAR